MLRRIPVLVFFCLGSLCLHTQTRAKEQSCTFDAERGKVNDCLMTDAKGQLRIASKYLLDLTFENDLAAVFSESHGWLYADQAGKVLITGVAPMDNGPDSFHDGLVRIIRNGRYGFANRNGQVVIPPRYDGALNFENGKAKVCVGCVTKCDGNDCEHRVFDGGQRFDITTGSETPEPITRVFNPNGWQVPALKSSHVKNGTTAHVPAVSNSIKYQMTVLVPSVGQELSKVPLVHLDPTQKWLVYDERTIRVLEITRYEVNTKPYCYRVSVMLKSEEPKSHLSGWAGELDLYYYDESGEGTWTVMDTAGPILPDIPKPAWERR